MSSTLLASVAALAYLASAVLLWRGLKSGERPPLRAAFALGGVAATAHAGALWLGVITPAGLELDFALTASLVAWEVALLMGLAALRAPVASLGLALLPLAAVCALVPTFAPAPARVIALDSPLMGAHVILALLAYGLLTLGAVQALALAWQERGLRAHDLRGVLGWLPPLTVMEELLFQLIATGLALLTLALAAGLPFVEDLRGQHLSHKVVLSWIAWATFALLLWGRWRHGWRGRVAINWTLAGFVFLALAYFGSRFVLEVLLGRSWG
jgi:ABC-type uncharacterized transport system permease subunit